MEILTYQVVETCPCGATFSIKETGYTLKQARLAHNRWVTLHSACVANHSHGGWPVLMEPEGVKLLEGDNGSETRLP